MADNAIPLERTLALIKPDSVDDSSEIERIIKTSGFAILAKRRVNLSPEQVSDFYAEHYGKVKFPPTFPPLSPTLLLLSPPF